MKHMKHRSLLLILAILPCAFSLRADDEGPLEGQMKILARGTRQLGQQISNPAMQQSSIALLETLKKAAVDSKALAPSRTKEIPEDKRASFLADYRTDLDELKDAFDQVEQAVKAGDYAKAQSLLATVNSIKKEGHSKFKED
jgi:soluble cytochrome b562